MVRTTERQRAARSASAPEQLLRDVGLRVTVPRLTVLDVVAEHPHADVSTVLERTRQRTAGVSVQGVYDVLTALTAAGLLRRLQPGQSAARYELDRGDNHHHVVCRECRTIRDVPCTTGSPPCLDASRPEAAGFAVDEAEVIFWGRCAACRAADGPGTTREQDPHEQTPRKTEKKEKE
ncbi:Fur family transcriptional regulator [Ornithinimicrobium avium]|uniref:Transcriptional repressor n=1 Tax=Ornithinimicrobium avium TaxID=2283195 RepID=A0A345NJ38_9MICO|nr:Fur family transcriptional regulator [Ornithinimicrobium avium]AXH95046.1 transcriptional repressor [Ornithinimicrobium avium]